MRRNHFFVVGIVLAMVALQSCSSSDPVNGLLKKYFQAAKMNDKATMSAIAVDPVNVDVDSWSLSSASQEKSEPVTLPGLDKKEKELKKAVADHNQTVLNADDAQYGAKQNYDNARTAANKKALDDAKANYEKERELHKQMQKELNDAITLAKKEESIVLSSLGTQQLANIRDLTGQVFSKEADVKIKAKDGSEKNFRVFVRRYELKDEAVNRPLRGRYLIVKFEPIN